MVAWMCGSHLRYKKFPRETRFLNFKNSANSAEGCYIGRLFNLILAVVEEKKSPITTESPHFNPHSWESGQGRVTNINSTKPAV